MKTAEGDFANMESIVSKIIKFATHDGPGIRTVVFVKGCPLRCKWCHSPESWNRSIERFPDGEPIGRTMTSDEALTEVVKDRDFYEASGGGLTVSGGEPLFSWEFTAELLAKAKASGIGTAVETSGYAPSLAIEKVAESCDLWLYDIKGMDSAKHKEHTGVDNAAILRNLRWLNAHGARIVLRCPMIPGENDFDANLKALGELADELDAVERLDVEPYVPYGIDMAKRLGIKLYEAPMPPPGYADEIVRKLQSLTKKKVVKG